MQGIAPLTPEERANLLANFAHPAVALSRQWVLDALYRYEATVVAALGNKCCRCGEAGLKQLPLCEECFASCIGGGGE